MSMISSVRVDDWNIERATPDLEQSIYGGDNNNNEKLDPPVKNEDILSFIDKQRRDKESGFVTFVATPTTGSASASTTTTSTKQPPHSCEDSILGHIHCQNWKGPVPLIVKEEAFKLGSVWGLSAVSDDVAKSLIKKALQHLKDMGCKCALTMTVLSNHIWFTESNFVPGNLLTLELPSPSPNEAEDTVEGITIEINDGIDNETGTSLSSSSLDAVVSNHWERMWLECGVLKEMLEDDLHCRTSDFIKYARSAGHGYATVVARNTADSVVIGTASCQLWEGVVPTSKHSKLGTVWAVYVRPEYRKRGVARVMMQRVIEHWKRLGCERGILLHASEEGRRVYERLGFCPNNCLVAQLVCDDPSVAEEKKENEEHRTPPVATIDTPTEEMVSELRAYDGNLMSKYNNFELKMLLRALPTQLQAVFGQSDDQGSALISAVQSVQQRHGVINMVTDEENWLIQNAGKMGRGFDMKKLASHPSKLAAKFDRLASKYDHWHVGNQSQVERFVAERARIELTTPGGLSSQDKKETVVLDVACGIGLQAGVLRLAGYEGHITGIDISQGMIARAKDRETYDEAYVMDIHDGLKNLVGDSTIDLVICTDAMELLDHQTVLSEFARVLKPGGQLWTSMQWEGALDEEGNLIPNPTAHQNVTGITQQDAIDELEISGFSLHRNNGIQECQCAFRTPSPTGDGTFLPVPYLFIVATRRPF